VELAGDNDGFECTVIESSLLKHHVIAEYAGVEVRARLMQDEAPPARSRIRLRFPRAQRLLFDAAGQRLSA
jgi:multiple sugar transport system ATP-binding protein